VIHSIFCSFSILVPPSSFAISDTFDFLSYIILFLFLICLTFEESTAFFLVSICVPIFWLTSTVFTFLTIVFDSLLLNLLSSMITSFLFAITDVSDLLFKIVLFVVRLILEAGILDPTLIVIHSIFCSFSILVPPSSFAISDTFDFLSYIILFLFLICLTFEESTAFFLVSTCLPCFFLTTIVFTFVTIVFDSLSLTLLFFDISLYFFLFLICLAFEWSILSSFVFSFPPSLSLIGAFFIFLTNTFVTVSLLSTLSILAEVFFILPNFFDLEFIVFSFDTFISIHQQPLVFREGEWNCPSFSVSVSDTSITPSTDNLKLEEDSWSTSLVLSYSSYFILFLLFFLLCWPFSFPSICNSFLVVFNISYFLWLCCTSYLDTELKESNDVAVANERSAIIESSSESRILVFGGMSCFPSSIKLTSSVSSLFFFVSSWWFSIFSWLVQWFPFLQVLPANISAIRWDVLSYFCKENSMFSIFSLSSRFSLSLTSLTNVSHTWWREEFDSFSLLFCSSSGSYWPLVTRL